MEKQWHTLDGFIRDLGKREVRAWTPGLDAVESLMRHDVYIGSHAAQLRDPGSGSVCGPVRVSSVSERAAGMARVYAPYNDEELAGIVRQGDKEPRLLTLEKAHRVARGRRVAKEDYLAAESWAKNGFTAVPGAADAGRARPNSEGEEEE